jgi:hypothetical protein
MMQVMNPDQIDAAFRQVKKNNYGVDDYSSKASIPAEYLAEIELAYKKTPMRKSTYDASEFLETSTSSSSTSGGVSKRGYEEIGQGAAARCAKNQKLSEDAPFEVDCTCGSFQEHCVKHYNKSAVNVMKHSFSNIDPTSLDITSLTEQSNYTGLIATIEHFTDAGVGALYDDLVPVIHRTPDSALSVNIISTTYLPTASTPIAQGAMPGVVQSTIETRNTVLRLVGLAAKMPLNALTTTRGTQMWFQMMLQVSKGFALTERYGAILALAGCWRYSHQNPMAIKHKISLDEYHDQLARNWARLQNCNQNAYACLVGDLDQILLNQNAQDGQRVMLCSPHVQRVLTRENHVSTRYDVSGPAGPAALWGDNPSVCEISGHITYVTPMFRFPQNVQTHPLVHYAEIGEYTTSLLPTAAYASCERDINVFTDSGWERVTFDEMIEQLPFWSKIGSGNEGDDDHCVLESPQSIRNEEALQCAFPYLDYDGHGIRGPTTVTEMLKWTTDRFTKPATANEATMIPDFNKIPSNTSFTKEAMLALHREGKPVPLGIIFTRPFKQYFVADVMWMKKGGVAYRLNRDGMATIADNMDRTHSLIAERYQGTCVVYPNNAAFGRNVVVIERRVGMDGKSGESTLAIPVPANPTNTDEFDPMNFTFGGASICIAVPWWFRKIPRNLNIIGRADILNEGFQTDAVSDYTQNGHPAAALIDALYGITERITNGTRIVQGLHGTEGTSHPPNTVCRMEPFWKYDKDNKATIFVAGNGYWQPWGTYEGAHIARECGVFSPVSDSRIVATGTGR